MVPSYSQFWQADIEKCDLKLLIPYIQLMTNYGQARNSGPDDGGIVSVERKKLLSIHVANVMKFCRAVFFRNPFEHHLCSYGHWRYMEFYFIMIFINIFVTITGIFMTINYLLIYTLGFLYISNSGSANAQLPRCFCPWTFSWILDWTCFLGYPLCHVYIPNRIFYRGNRGFATDCPCSV